VGQAQAAHLHLLPEPLEAPGAVGPELTAASSKYTRRDILESIIDPSKVVSEQYQNLALALKNGDDVTGRIIEEDSRRIVVVTDPLLL